MFDRPTVAGLAEAVGDAVLQAAAPGPVSSLLADLEGLSDEEAERLA